MKTKIAIYALVAILLTAAILTSALYYKQYEEQKKENKELKAELVQLNDSFSRLVTAFEDVRKQKTYSISLAPNINSKVISTFGATKNVTLQYFFTMDGAKMEIQPDSVYEVRKIED
jgi:transcription antitermination factor NusG